MGDRERIIHEYLWSYLTAERQTRLQEVLDWRTRHLTVVLENVYQPHNTSAVLRTCDAFGVQDVHVVETENRFRVTRQIAMGTEKWLTLHRHAATDNPAAVCIDRLRQDGYRILVTAPSSTASPPTEIDITRKTALVIGHETDGVSACFADAADECVAIPMYGFVESFNLSVAAALCLYELTDQLHRSDIDWRLTSVERESLLIEWTRKSVPHLDSIEERFWRDYQPD
ncbi:MAG: RNA methyltransferase [Planctomycetaceae bacterium]